MTFISFLFFISVLYSALFSPVEINRPFTDTGVKVYVVRQQIHTGLILSVNKHLLTLIPELKEFSDKNFVDIGWGDEAFYQYPGFDIYLAAKALFLPTSSVLRVAGFNSDLTSYYGVESTIIELSLTESSFEKLAFFISSEFKKDSSGNQIETSGIGSSIVFYKARSIYSLFFTCNTWIASGLNQAGVSINPTGIIIVEQLLREVSKHGKVIYTPE